MKNKTKNNSLLYIGIMLLLLGFLFFESFGFSLCGIGFLLICISRLKKRHKNNNKDINIEDVRKIIICPNCGAKNVVRNSNSKCDYCDSYIE